MERVSRLTRLDFDRLILIMGIDWRQWTAIHRFNLKAKPFLTRSVRQG